MNANWCRRIRINFWDGYYRSELGDNKEEENTKKLKSIPHYCDFKYVSMKPLFPTWFSNYPILYILSKFKCCDIKNVPQNLNIL